jgi:hypothetical protein
VKGQPGARHLEAVTVLVLRVLVVVQPARLEQPVELQPEAPVGAGEEEVPVPAGHHAVLEQARPRVGVREDVLHDLADLLGPLLGHPVVTIRGLKLVDLGAEAGVLLVDLIELLADAIDLILQQRSTGPVLRQARGRRGQAEHGGDQTDSRPAKHPAVLPSHSASKPARGDTPSGRMTGSRRYRPNAGGRSRSKRTEKATLSRAVTAPGKQDQFIH